MRPNFLLIVASLMTASMTSLTANAGDTFSYGAGATCGVFMGASYLTPNISLPKKILTAVGVGAACGAIYYFLVSIGEHIHFSSLTDDQAKQAIVKNFKLAMASDVFGEKIIMQILKLPKEQQTPQNIDRILGESLGLNPDACALGSPNCA